MQLAVLYNTIVQASARSRIYTAQVHPISASESSLNTLLQMMPASSLDVVESTCLISYTNNLDQFVLQLC